MRLRLLAALLALATLGAGNTPSPGIPTPHIEYEPINEGQSIRVPIIIRDQGALLNVPDQVWWWCYDIGTGELLYLAPSPTPASQIILRLPPQCFRIVNDLLTEEPHYLSVGVLGGGDWTVTDARYLVRNKPDIIVGQGTPGTWGPTPVFTPTRTRTPTRTQIP